MIAVDIDGVRFQLRAGALVVDDGWVLLHRIGADPYWSVPGGRVDPGEDAATTVVREMREEIGAEVTVVRLLHVIENFFPFRDRSVHEVNLNLLVTLAPGSALADRTRAHHGAEGSLPLEFRWFPLAALGTLDVRPACLADALREPGLPFRHMVSRN